MAERRRLFLTGNNRAEFEHVHGPLTSDTSDPRFVLVTEEEAEKIRVFPPGVPPYTSDDWHKVKRIREAEFAEYGVDSGDLADTEASGEDVGKDVKAGSEAADNSVAESGTPVPAGSENVTATGDDGSDGTDNGNVASDATEPAAASTTRRGRR